MMASRKILLLATVIMLACAANAYVAIKSDRLAAEMKYWLCSAEGETSDLLLHVMIEKTLNESEPKNAAADCSTFAAAVSAVNAAAAAYKWIQPDTENGKQQQWEGCNTTTCAANPTAVVLKMDAPTYVRLLEFGHEQAVSCSNPTQAIDTFVGRLVAAGCDNRVCEVTDYVNGRPTATDGCKAILVA